MTTVFAFEILHSQSCKFNDPFMNTLNVKWSICPAGSRMKGGKEVKWCFLKRQMYGWNSLNAVGASRYLPFPISIHFLFGTLALATFSDGLNSLAGKGRSCGNDRYWKFAFSFPELLFFVSSAPWISGCFCFEWSELVLDSLFLEASVSCR